LVLALAAACESGGDDDLGPAATIGPGPTTTTVAAAPVDVGVIPDDPAEIDEAYVQAVVDALFAVDAQATKIFVETKELDERAIDILRSIYLPEELDRQVDSWFQSLAQRAENLLPGQLGNEVEQVIDVTDDCVYLEASRDYSKTTKRQVSPGTIYLGLTQKTETDDLEGLNPTAWMLFMDGLNPDGSRPENPCEGR
jgi:hypothetical protein